MVCTCLCESNVPTCTSHLYSLLTARYVNTITGTKHIVILLDTSGSMFGLSSSLARLAATELINTLSGNDFFFVVSVNERSETGPINGCFRNKTMAIPENREAVKHLIQIERESHGVADFDYGLELGLQNLQVK